MAIELETAAKAAAGAVPAIVAVVGLARGPGAARSRLKHDLELLEKLPEDSEARTVLLNHLANQLRHMTTFESTATRNWATFLGTLVLAPLTGFLAVYLYQRKAWWGSLGAVPVALMALVLVYGIFESGQRAPRDHKGNRLKE